MLSIYGICYIYKEKQCGTHVPSPPHFQVSVKRKWIDGCMVVRIYHLSCVPQLFVYSCNDPPINQNYANPQHDIFSLSLSLDIHCLWEITCKSTLLLLLSTSTNLIILTRTTCRSTHCYLLSFCIQYHSQDGIEPKQ